MRTAIPERMCKLPLDHRGYPVPVTIQRDTRGKPLFVANDSEAVAKCIKRKLCSICGERLTRELWFTGGPNNALHPHGGYLDPAMHHECLSYALQVCPYLATPREYLNEQLIDRLQERVGERIILIDPTTDPERPEVFMAVMSYGQSLIPRPRQAPVIKPLRPYHAVEFWRHGIRLEFEAGLEIISKIRGLDLSGLRLVRNLKGVRDD